MMRKELSREYEFKYENVAKADITIDYFPLRYDKRLLLLELRSVG